MRLRICRRMRAQGVPVRESFDTKPHIQLVASPYLQIQRNRRGQWAGVRVLQML